MLAQLAFESCLGKCKQQFDRENSARAWFESTGSRVIWNVLAERCLKSYCSVVSLYCFDTLWNFSASLPRNLDVVDQRWTTSRGVLHRRGRCCSTRTISSTIAGSFVKRQRKQLGRIVSSDHGCWTRTPRQNSSSSYLTSYVDEVSFADPRRKLVIVVNVRLTARLQSLPLARCWPACFALFSSFFPLLFRLTLTVVNWLYVGCVQDIIIQTNYTYCLCGA